MALFLPRPPVHFQFPSFGKCQKGSPVAVALLIFLVGLIGASAAAIFFFNKWREALDRQRQLEAEIERQKPNNQRRDLELKHATMRQELAHLEERIGELLTQESGQIASRPQVEPIGSKEYA